MARSKLARDMKNASELSVLEAATRKGPAVEPTEPEDVALREGGSESY